MEMFDETIISLPDERGFALAREMEAKASINQAEVKGLIRVVRKLGHVLKQVIPITNISKERKSMKCTKIQNWRFHLLSSDLTENRYDSRL